jgi:hypothetical protein
MARDAVAAGALQQFRVWPSSGSAVVATTSGAGSAAWALQQHHQLPGVQDTRSTAVRNRRERESFTPKSYLFERSGDRPLFLP